MTCRQGASDVKPLPVDFASAEELRTYLGLPDTARGRAILAAITPAERRTYAEIRAVERELQAGRIPRGVIACDRRARRAVDRQASKKPACLPNPDAQAAATAGVSRTCPVGPLRSGRQPSDTGA